MFQSAPLESTYKYKNGCLTYADGMFYLYADNGNMVLARPTDSGFDVTGRLTVEDPGERPTWAHPVCLRWKTLRPLWWQAGCLSRRSEDQIEKPAVCRITLATAGLR